MGIIRPTNDAIWYYYWSLVVDIFVKELISEHNIAEYILHLDDENESFLCTQFGALNRSYLGKQCSCIFVETTKWWSTCKLFTNLQTYFYWQLVNWLKTICELILNTTNNIFWISTGKYKLNIENITNIIWQTHR